MKACPDDAAGQAQRDRNEQKIGLLALKHNIITASLLSSHASSGLRTAGRGKADGHSLTPTIVTKEICGQPEGAGGAPGRSRPGQRRRARSLTRQARSPGPARSPSRNSAARRHGARCTRSSSRRQTRQPRAPGTRPRACTHARQPGLAPHLLAMQGCTVTHRWRMSPAARHRTKASTWH